MARKLQMYEAVNRRAFVKQNDDKSDFVEFHFFDFVRFFLYILTRFLLFVVAL